MARIRPAKIEQQTETYLNKVSREVQSNQSKLSLVLGALIILVLGILVFNYFNKSRPGLGPSQTTEQQRKYTVKEGDTLFLIAQNYYQDGYRFTEIAKANNLTNVDQIEVGQVLEIPKIEVAQVVEEPPLGTGGGDTTIWGPKILGDTYTVLEGDWLSKIAARAYGDIMAFPKIAQANKIQNPDLIYPGMILTIPR